MATSNGPSASITSGTPVYRDGLFRQTFTVTAPQAIPPEVFQRVFDKATDMFRGALGMNYNERTDYQWPPQHVEANPSADLKTVFIEFHTRAKIPEPMARPPGLVMQ